MTRISTFAPLIAACLILGGCAHPISMTPDLAAIQPAVGVPTIAKKVGLHISDASKAIEVTTPGGGGDKIRYFPYRDMEPAIYKTLASVFQDVTKISNPQDTAAMSQSGISLLITPEITTTSSSESPFTWPPTKFSVTLICAIKDAQGLTVDTMRATGTGEAEFSEFKGNFSLAAVRASNDAIQKLGQALRQSPALMK